MRLCCLIVGVLVLTGIVLAQESASITVGSGTLKIGGLLQSTYTYNLSPESANEFRITRARLRFLGNIIKDKVDYFIQTDDVRAPALLDVKLTFKNCIPMTSLTVGRFSPAFTLYMPLSSSKLDLVNYPLLTQKYANGIGYKGAANTGRGVWRQPGIQTTSSIGKMVDISLAVLNGGLNNTTDADKYKNFLGRLDVKPVELLTVGGYGLLGKDKTTLFDTTGSNNINSTKPTTYMRYGGYLDLSWQKKLAVKAEAAMGKDEGLAVKDTVTAEVKDTKSLGVFVHAGYQVVPLLEALVRYDLWDPNTTDTALKDKETWVTLGVNIPINGLKTKVFVNYIINLEEDSNAKVDDNQVVVQAQVAF